MKLQKAVFTALLALLLVSVLFATFHTPQGPTQGYQQPTIENNNF